MVEINPDERDIYGYGPVPGSEGIGSVGYGAEHTTSFPPRSPILWTHDTISSGRDLNSPIGVPIASNIALTRASDANTKGLLQFSKDTIQSAAAGVAMTYAFAPQQLPPAGQSIDAQASGSGGGITSVQGVNQAATQAAKSVKAKGK